MAAEPIAKRREGRADQSGTQRRHGTARRRTATA